jgi:hypothetical protein
VSDLTSPAGPPAEITHLVRERTEARARHDWPKADELKAQIEAAGWRVVDRGSRTSIGPAAPATVAVDGEVRYGAASAVPSLLDAPATAAWTVVVLASEQPERVSRLLTALRTHAPAGTQVVAVANDPSESQTAALAADAPDRAPISGTVPEILRTSTRLGYAAALNIALQRAAGEFVLLTDATAWPAGDTLSPLATALHDPEVAAAGAFGLYSGGAGPIRPGALTREPAAAVAGDEAAAEDVATADGAATAAAEATALEGAWLAFRRSDYIELGPLDEHFVTPAWLDVWWTLRLRAGEEPEGAEYVETAMDESGEADGAPADEVEHEFAMPKPRRAVRLALSLERDEVAWPPDRVRLNRRNMYRVLDRFGWREDLA